MALAEGRAAETLALRWLQARGLELVARNAFARGGELDLVMRDREVLAIIEVRRRGREDFGSALESVDARKQARIVRATRALLARRPELARLPIRFDVLTLDGEDRIDWLKNAFDAGA